MRSGCALVHPLRRVVDRPAAGPAGSKTGAGRSLWIARTRAHSVTPAAGRSPRTASGPVVSTRAGRSGLSPRTRTGSSPRSPSAAPHLPVMAAFRLSPPPHAAVITL